MNQSVRRFFSVKSIVIVPVFLFMLVMYALLLWGPLFMDPTSTVVLDRNGILLGARVASDGQWRFPVNAPVAEKIEIATVVFEDRYFYKHPGINPVSLGRACFRNLKARKVISGGSTLTMQTIRLSRKGKSRNIAEKMIEMVLATRLELGKKKSEILSLYTSNAPYGGNVVGVETAAWRYYGTSAKNLSWAEAATLAVLPNSPGLVHPGRNSMVLLKKRNRLLERLYGLGWIDKTTFQTGLHEPVPVSPLPMPGLAPHLLDRMNSEKSGQVITSTIDAQLQEQCSEIVLNHQEKLQYNQIHNAAAIIIEVETGAVLAYVGNSGSKNNNAHGGDVDIIRSPRSTGSLLKPVLYAAMLDDGKILPNSLVTDIPMNISGFAPKNFDGQFEGAVRANRALSRSLNVPAVEMLQEYGVDRFHHLLKDLGMKTLNRQADQYGLSLILGGAEGSLAEMTNIYACFSRVLNHFAKAGLYYPGDYRSIQFVKSMSAPEKGETEPGFISASALWFTYIAMKEVNRPDAESGWKYFGSSGTIAWKTGTSFGYRDGWAIGTSPQYVVGVWVGNADGEGRPGLTGIATAAPVMFELFGLLPRSGWFSAPADELIPAIVCRKSGYLAGPNCDEADTVRVPLKGIRSPACHYHRVVHLTTDRKYRVNRNCMMPERMIHCSWFVLPPVQEWYYKKMHNDYAGLPPFMTGCDEGNQRSMDLVYPGEGTTLYIPVVLGGKKSRVIFEAVHRASGAVIYWHLDGQFICSTKDIHQVEVLPDKGKHTLVMIDEKGEELVRHFVIMEKDD